MIFFALVATRISAGHGVLFMKGAHAAEKKVTKISFRDMRRTEDSENAISCHTMHASLLLNMPSIQTERPKTSHTFVFFIFDAADIQCPLCQDAILDLIDTLSVYESRIFITGLCVYRFPGLDSADQEEKKAIHKQITGFFQGNQVPFPIVFDESSLLVPFIQNHSFLVLIRTFPGIVKYWTIPLYPEDWEELFLLIQ